MQRVSALDIVLALAEVALDLKALPDVPTLAGQSRDDLWRAMIVVRYLRDIVDPAGAEARPQSVGVKALAAEEADRLRTAVAQLDETIAAIVAGQPHAGEAHYEIVEREDDDR